MNDVFTQMINIAYVYVELLPNYDVCPSCTKRQISFALHINYAWAELALFEYSIAFPCLRLWIYILI